MFHFISGNLDVGAKPRFKRLTQDGAGVREELEYDWEEPMALTQLQEALVNYGALQQQFFPQDHTPFTIIRVLIKYRWIANAPNNEVKLRIISVFFETVSRGNATRASNGLAPMSFERQEALMKDVLVKHGVSSEVPYVIPKHGQAGSSNGAQWKFY